MITIRNLKFNYKTDNDSITDDTISSISCNSFSVNRGEIVCISGNKACGKSTLAKLLAGIKIPHKGKIEIENNISVSKNETLFKKIVGYLPSEDIFYPELSFDEYLNFLNSSYGFSKKYLSTKINWFSEYIDIKNQNFLKMKAGESSSLAKQKIKIFSTLLHNPKLLILDEPYLNLDFDAILKLNQVLYYLATDHFVTIVIISNSQNKESIKAIKKISSKFIFMSPNGDVSKEILTAETQYIDNVL